MTFMTALFITFMATPSAMTAQFAEKSQSFRTLRKQTLQADAISKCAPADANTQTYTCTFIDFPCTGDTYRSTKEEFNFRIWKPPTQVNEMHAQPWLIENQSLKYAHWIDELFKLDYLDRVVFLSNRTDAVRAWQWTHSQSVRCKSHAQSESLCDDVVES